MALVKALLNGNEVEYDDTEFEIRKEVWKKYSISYLHYIGNGGAVNNPKGNTSCYKMFNKCLKIKVLDLSNFDTSKVSNMSHMFKECMNIEVLDVSHFDTSNVTSMEYMFAHCESLTKLDVSHFDTSKVSNMSHMFYFCPFLTELDVSNFDTSNVVDTSLMFGCPRLTGLDVSNFDTSKVTNMRHMFGGCKSLTKLDVSNFDTSKVVEMEDMFNSCESLIELDLSNFDTSNVTNMTSMFCSCSSLKELNVSHFDTSNVTDMSCMFSGCEHLTELDVSHFDTSNVTTMWAMFRGCKSLKKVDLSNFDTSKVTNMRHMFEGCMSLKELDLSHFKMSRVEASDTFGIFKYCQSLISLNLSGFDTVICSMFDDCTSLSSLDLSNLSKFYVLPYFRKCNNLENIVFKRLDILSYSVEDLKIIFVGCPYLDKLLAEKSKRKVSTGSVSPDKLLAEKSKRKVSTGSVSPATGYLINTSPSKSGCMYPLGEVGILGIASNPLDGSKLLENMIIDLLNQDEKAVLKKHKGVYGIKDPYFVSILSMVKPKSEMIYDYCDRVIIPNIKKLFQKTNGRSSLTVGDVFKKLSTTYGESLTAIALARFLSDEYLVD